MKQKRNGRNWRKGTFTIEAAYLVPIAAAAIVLVIGYIYYTHERSWSRAVAYEADFYGIQRREGQESAGSLIQERVSGRNEEKPLPLKQETFQVTDGGDAVSVSWSGSVLNKVFSSRFGYQGTAELQVVRPVEVKRNTWLTKYGLQTFGIGGSGADED